MVFDVYFFKLNGRVFISGARIIEYDFQNFLRHLSRKSTVGQDKTVK